MTKYSLNTTAMIASISSVPACMNSANLNVVALVIHHHAGTHVPVQYIQAYIQFLLVQLEHAHRMITAHVTD